MSELERARRRMRFAHGFTLVEMSLASTVSVLLTLAVGALLVSGNNAWERVYRSANNQVKADALAVTAAFGAMGRRSNRLDYTLYKYDGRSLSPARPSASKSEEVVYGEAVEFRFWDVPLDENDSHHVMDVEKNATAYALFYLADGELKVDYGPYPPGAAVGGARNTSGVRTQLLAKNVTVGAGEGVFSHTVQNGIGEGSVRMNVVLTDPVSGESIAVVMGTLMRSIWPQ